MELNDTISQLDLTDIYKTPNPNNAGHTLSKAAQEMFSKIYHAIRYKETLENTEKLK